MLGFPLDLHKLTVEQCRVVSTGKSWTTSPSRKLLSGPENLVKESPERWDVPLPVSEIGHELPFRFFPRNAKRLVESSAGRSDP